MNRLSLIRGLSPAQVRINAFEVRAVTKFLLGHVGIAVAVSWVPGNTTDSGLT